MQDALTVGIESEAEESHALHKLLGLGKFSVAAEEGIHELNARVLAQTRLLLLRSLEHRGLAGLEQSAELLCETLAGVNKVGHDLSVFGAANAANDVLRALDLAGELNQQEPELARHVGNGRVGTRSVDGPVVDPLAQAVGVKNAAEEQNGLL